MNTRHIAGVLLAAGAARRYGKAKQLEKFGGISLVRHAATALLAACDEVLVVVGANADVVSSELATLPLAIVSNAHWQDGMGGSIARACSELASRNPSADAILLHLADQPLIGAAQLQRVIAISGQYPDRIIVANHGRQRGPPCLFPARFHDELRKLGGDVGAKPVLQRHAELIQLVDMPEAEFDVDTPEDLERIRARR